MCRCVCLAACLLALAFPAFARTWNDTEGHTVEGEFVRVLKGKVVINVAGRMVQVPFGHLVEDDQDFVREQLEAKGLGSQLPAKKKPAAPDSAAEAGSDGKDAAAANDPKPGPERKWTDIQGRSIQARFIGIEDANVVLHFKGKRTTFPFDKFSLADQRFVRTEMTGRGEGDKVPAEVAPVIPQPAPAAPQFAHAPPMIPAMPAMPRMPEFRFPTIPTPAPIRPAPYQPPPMVAPSFPAPVQAPPMPEPNMPPSFSNNQPAFQQVMVKKCSKCGAVLPSSVTAGDRCPSCGTYLAYDQTNGKTAYAGAYFYGSLAGTGTLIALGVSVLVRIFKRS